MQNFKDLKVWEKSHKLTISIYDLTKSYPKEELFGITSQIRRAAFSIPSNIAEGCGRNSRNDFANFLNIALGSANEVEYTLILSKDLGYISTETYEANALLINEIKAMLIALINKIRNAGNPAI